MSCQDSSTSLPAPNQLVGEFENGVAASCEVVDGLRDRVLRQRATAAWIPRLPLSASCFCHILDARFDDESSGGTGRRTSLRDSELASLICSLDEQKPRTFLRIGATTGAAATAN